MRFKCLITTLDPQYGGGTLTMTRAACRILHEIGIEPVIFYISMHKKFSLRIEKCNFDNYEALTVGYLPTPNVYLNYYLPSLKLKDYLSKFDIFFSVGAGNQHAMPFLIHNKPYICWIATAVSDEYNSRRLIEEALNNHWLWVTSYLSMPLTLEYEKKIYQKASKIFSLSKYTMHRIMAMYKIPKEKILYLPYPVGDLCNKKLSSELPFNNPYILYVGRIDDPRKNLELLVNAFEIVVRQNPNLLLVLVGEKRNNSYIQNLVHIKNLQSHVVFTGKVDNLINYYEHASLFVLPSNQEGLGIVLLEAMSHGIPVVATRCGGPQELIIDGYNGYLVDIDDIKAMSEKILQIVCDDSLQRKMAINAKDMITRKFNYTYFRQILISVLNEVFDLRI